MWLLYLILMVVAFRCLWPIIIGIWAILLTPIILVFSWMWEHKWITLFILLIIVGLAQIF